MKVRFLGTAAGGGLPQWNCACESCALARHSGTSRTQDCLAITGDGSRWYLVNASPDLRTQILRTPELIPGPGPRDTALAGVLFTSAELDHTLGLITLREARALSVYATTAMMGAFTETFPIRSIIGGYAGVQWNTITAGEIIELDGGLRAVAVVLNAKRPRYAAPPAPVAGAGGRHAVDNSPDPDDWVVAYRFWDQARPDQVFVYAPCLGDWSPQFEQAIKGATCIALDGTCFTDDEMARLTGGGSASRAMGHLPISDSLTQVRELTGVRCLYTHVNNTNPAAHDDTAERLAVRAVGADIAADGQLLEL